VSLPHPKARRAVVTALGEFQDKGAAAALIGVVTRNDASYFVEAEAAAALGKTRQPGALEQLQRLSQIPSWNEVVRGGGCRGLAELKDDRAIALLVDFTAYGLPAQARYAAMRALGKLGSEKATVPETILDVLTALLDEESFRTRMAVLDALETLKSPKTLPALQRLSVRDLDGRVKRRLEEVSNTLRNTQPSPDELQQLRDEVKSLHTANNTLRERLDRFEAQQAAATG
jgi:aminopeptidase N